MNFQAKDSSRKPKPDDRGADSSPTPSDKRTTQADTAGAQTPDVALATNNETMGDDEEEEEISTNHVMLSYQWGVQKHILKVKELLQAEGYKVWMDVDHMGKQIVSLFN